MDKKEIENYAHRITNQNSKIPFFTATSIVKRFSEAGKIDMLDFIDFKAIAIEDWEHATVEDLEEAIQLTFSIPWFNFPLTEKQKTQELYVMEEQHQEYIERMQLSKEEIENLKEEEKKLVNEVNQRLNRIAFLNAQILAGNDISDSGETYKEKLIKVEKEKEELQSKLNAIRDKLSNASIYEEMSKKAEEILPYIKPKMEEEMDKKLSVALKNVKVEKGLPKKTTEAFGKIVEEKLSRFDAVKITYEIEKAMMDFQEILSKQKELSERLSPERINEVLQKIEEKSEKFLSELRTAKSIFKEQKQKPPSEPSAIIPLAFIDIEATTKKIICNACIDEAIEKAEDEGNFYYLPYYQIIDEKDKNKLIGVKGGYVVDWVWKIKFLKIAKEKGKAIGKNDKTTQDFIREKVLPELEPYDSNYWVWFWHYYTEENIYNKPPDDLIKKFETILGKYFLTKEEMEEIKQDILRKALTMVEADSLVNEIVGTESETIYTEKGIEYRGKGLKGTKSEIEYNERLIGALQNLYIEKGVAVHFWMKDMTVYELCEKHQRKCGWTYIDSVGLDWAYTNYKQIIFDLMKNQQLVSHDDFSVHGIKPEDIDKWIEEAREERTKRVFGGGL